MKSKLALVTFLGIVLAGAFVWLSPYPNEFLSQFAELTKPINQANIVIANVDDGAVPPRYKLLKNSNYGFQLAYPESWSIQGNLSDGPLNYMPINITNFYSKIPPQEEPVINNVVVYEKPNNLSFRTWVMKGYATTELGGKNTFDIPDKLAEGTIDTSLEEAQKGHEGLISYTERTEKGRLVVEIGAVQVAGTLSYTRYVVNNMSSLVYALNMNLPFQYIDTDLYAKQFKAAVATFNVFSKTP